MLRLESVIAKIDRADEHCRLIEKELAAWFKEHPYSIVEKVNGDFTRHSMILSVETPPPIMRWSLMFGDSIHSLRCALDHLVYAISVHELDSDPPPNEGITQFLINDRPEDFKSKLWRIAALSLPVKQAIDGVQPYNRPHPRMPPLLGLLRDLDDADKHRLIKVAVHTPISYEVSATGFGFDADDLHFETRYDVGLEDGAEIAWVTSTRPTPHLHLEASVTLTVVVMHKPGPTGIYGTGIEVLLAGDLIPEVREVIQTVSAAVVP